MRRLASFVAILILLSAAAPLLACMTGKAMTREESVCCRSMHGNCGGMETMGCCNTEVRTDHNPQIAAAAPITDVPLTVIGWLAPLPASARSVATFLFQSPSEHSPPGLLAAQITVLRI